MKKTKKDEETAIKIYKRHNTLKDMLGVRTPSDEPGHIDQELIDKADEIISKMCEECEQSIGEQVELLSKFWKEMIEAKNDADKRKEKSEKIFTIAHEIKDISSLCGYTLIADFAESLRDYIAETALNLKNQEIIIQAHVDAITTVHKNRIKEDAGPVAEELKKMVKIAIDKYH